MKPEQTFMHFLLQHQQKHNRSLNFVILMESILTAARLIQSKYQDAAIDNNLDGTNSLNVQGENVQKFDLLAQDIFLHYLRESNQVLQAVSEESEHPINLNPDGRYLVYFDPLDGSGNIKSSAQVGLLFGIAKRNLNGFEDLHLRQGRDFIAAGMFIIPAGIFVFALKDAGAWRFLFDTSGNCIRPSRLSFPTDKETWELSWNASYGDAFPEKVRDYISSIKNQYAFRYSGSFSLDFHRLLHRGGLFMYPTLKFPDKKKCKPEGKLRLLYECAVAAFIAEQAGGMAVDEMGIDILDKAPESAHQRSSIIIGNKELVEKYLDEL